MVAPLPALAPVIPPVLVPNVHANVLAALEVKAILVAVALQILDAFTALVTAGVGLTVTVKLVALPIQLPTVEVGITLYTILPAVVFNGLVKVWLIVAPLLALAPVIPPVLVPKVHANVLPTLEVKPILVAVALQILDAVTELVTTGVGLTVTVAVPVTLFEQAVELASCTLTKLYTNEPETAVGAATVTELPEVVVTVCVVPPFMV